MRLRAVLGLLAMGAAAATVLAWRAQAAADAERRAGIDRSLLRKWAIEEAGLRTSASGAGISLQRPRVEPLDRRRLGVLAEGDDFHTFLHRCTSCHTTPDPSLHTPSEWRGVVQRMDAWMRQAGVLPMDSAERAGVDRFLEDAAAGANGRRSPPP